MKNLISILRILSSLVIAGCTSPSQEKPPKAPIAMVTENHFGTAVKDPYRYMENLKDTTVVNWFKAQANYSRKVLDQIPGRKGLVDQLREMDGRRSVSIYEVNITRNDKYFYLKTTPEDETGKLFYRDSLQGNERLLFDPTNYRNDTLKYTLTALSPSLDGSKIAFEIAPNGSESAELLVLNVDSGKRYPEVIDRCWGFGASWLPDGERLLYLRWNSSDVHDKDRMLNSKAMLHTVGTSPDSDREIFSRQKYPNLGIEEAEYANVYYDPDTELLFALPMTDDRRVKAFIAPSKEIDAPTIHWKPLFIPEDEVYEFGTIKDSVFVRTPKNAPNFKILKTSLTHPDMEQAEVVVPESKNGNLEAFDLTSDGLYYTLSKNGVQQEVYYLPKGKAKATKIGLPNAAGRIGIRAKSIESPDFWVTLNGWTSDYRRYRFDPRNSEFIPENLSSQATYPEYVGLMVEELMVPSHDGTLVPLSLIYDKNLKREGKTPVFFLGYGAYGYAMSPFFSPAYLMPTTKGAIFAVAHVRGGGELGDTWHKGGMKTTKPNTWKDLIACGEYMVREKYTAPQKMAIYSASAGGVLIGRAMTERPDLFAVAIPEVGCMNTMRMEFTPNGPPNIPEFGTVKDSVECMALFEMDSYQHIVDGEKYPATLITAGMNDPRVSAWEPGKFAARLQAANASDKPILFSVDFEAGHGMGDTKTTAFDAYADVLSFALWQTGHPEFQMR